MRQEYEMTEDDLAVVLEACKPVVWLAPQGHGPTLPQAYANDAWRALGHKMGFDWMTAKSVAGKGNRFFTAEKSAPPTSFEETVQAVHDKIERLTRERDEARAACAGLTYQRDQYHAAVGFLLDGLDSNLDDKGGLTSAEWDVIIAKSRKLADEGSEPNPGQPLLADYDRLRRLEAAVVNREFVWQCPCTDCEDTTDCQDAICAALLAAMKGE